MARWTLLATGGFIFIFMQGTRADKPRRAHSGLEPLVRVLAASEDSALQRDVLQGMCEALQGRRHVAAPKGWSAVYRRLETSKDPEVRERSLVLSVLFGDPHALAELRRTAADPRTDPAARRRALQILVEKRAESVPSLLRKLLNDHRMRGPALRGLAAYNDPDTPALILRNFASYNDTEKADATSTLAGRPQYALALLEAMGQGKVQRRDVSPFIARQLLALKDKRVTAMLNKVWGSIRPAAADKSALLVRYKALVTPAALMKASRSHGRQVFARVCSTCHTVFGAGAKIGPDLTGSQRTNPEYILTKVVDPNAVVAQDYQITRITTADGRVISGIIKQESDKVIAIQTPTEVIRLPKSDIEERERLPVSLMPEGQLTTMTDVEVRDLLAYLAGPGQVPLPRHSSKAKRP
jgi:putative heme-binding domain-containing protein